MYFSNLKKDYSDYLEKGTPVESKQRINLSTQCYHVLLNDMDALGLLSSSDKYRVTSAFLNHIFRVFRQEASSSVAYMLTQKEFELKQIFGELSSTEKGQSRIAQLLKEEKKRLEQAASKRCSSKGISIVFRVDQNNIAYLAGIAHLALEDGKEQDGRKCYPDKVGAYLKAVIEEYSMLPYRERELIYCQEIVRDIHSAISQQVVVKLTLKSTTVVNGVFKHNIKYLKPLSIMADSEQQYNYLVGLVRNENDDIWREEGLRLSSIVETSILKQPAKLPAKTVKNIQNNIQQFGVQYLSFIEQVKTIVVKFTPQGEKMYHRMLHLRPLYTAHPEDLVYEFECPIQQAEHYFFKFGHDAEILSPQFLASKFKRKYQSAAKQYE